MPALSKKHLPKPAQSTSHGRGQNGASKVRNTKQKGIVWEVLERSHRPLSASDILEKLAQQGDKVDKTTVYRILENLVEDGRLFSFVGAHRVTLYELAPHRHSHFICSRCGGVTCLSVTPADSPKVPKGYKIDSIQSTVFGSCAGCDP